MNVSCPFGLSGATCLNEFLNVTCTVTGTQIQQSLLTLSHTLTHTHT